MRKRQKQDIIEILQSLYQANQEIEAALKAAQPELAGNMLCDCQECAIELGNIIEAAEGEGIEMVSLLEKYCEVLFHYYEKIKEAGQLEKKGAEKLRRALDKQVKEIENSLQNDIPERQEIVFMPYKASMWDALESVYLAAKEDPNCDAYCVPIPYFDKNPDGTLGQMHYEIDQYPKNIEVINRLSYKLEERRPDVIYIHNPYDECNHVTCVHPDYFSSRLKQYTDKLVYIPYFVLPEVGLDDQTAINKIKNYCFQPGIINANRVILQSENIRQIYINEYLKAAKAYGLTGDHLNRKKLEEKFLGSGSPKFDKVLNTKKENLEIPKEWLKVIQKEDGSWKKIILYNTSINALLQNEDKMLEKMKSVFNLFEKKQSQIALLWRPHPLIPSTIQSMRPELWEKYSRIVDTYKEEGWGIYDDSSDLDRAVVLSDGYYGDPSSVVEVYQKTGKPVMMQGMLTTAFNENMLFHTYKVVITEKSAWISMALFNGLFTLNLETGVIKWAGKFPDEGDTESNLFKDYEVLDEKIYFAPSNAKNIMVYDTLENKFTKIPFDVKKYRRNGGYSNVLIHDNEVIFVGVGRTDAICKYSIEKKQLIYMDTTAIENIEVGPYEELYGSVCCIKDCFLYVPLIKGGCAVRINLHTGKSALLNLKGEREFSFRIAVNILQKDAVWFIDKNGGIVELNSNGLTIIREEKDEEEYLTCDLDENNLYLFSRKIEKYCKCININTLKQENIDMNPIQMLHTLQKSHTKYYLGVKEDNRTYLLSENSLENSKEAVIHIAGDRKGLAYFEDCNILLFKKNVRLYHERKFRYQYVTLDMYIDKIVQNFFSDEVLPAEE